MTYSLPPLHASYTQPKTWAISLVCQPGETIYFLSVNHSRAQTCLTQLAKEGDTDGSEVYEVLRINERPVYRNRPARAASRTRLAHLPFGLQDCFNLLGYGLRLSRQEGYTPGE